MQQGAATEFQREIGLTPSCPIFPVKEEGLYTADTVQKETPRDRHRKKRFSFH
jgi:hypothetical protein